MISHFQNYEGGSCCFQPLSLWSFVTAAAGYTHTYGYREFGREIGAGDTGLRVVSRRAAEILEDCENRLFRENRERNPEGSKQRESPSPLE